MLGRFIIKTTYYIWKIKLYWLQNIIKHFINIIYLNTKQLFWFFLDKYQKKKKFFLGFRKKNILLFLSYVLKNIETVEQTSMKKKVKILNKKNIFRLVKLSWDTLYFWINTYFIWVHRLNYLL